MKQDDPKDAQESQEQEGDFPSRSLIWVCGFELALGLIAILVGSSAEFHPRKYLPPIEWPTLAQSTGLGVALALPMLLIPFAFQFFPESATQRMDLIRKQVLIPTFRKFGVAELATIALCAGVGEELLFRGMIQAYLAGSQWEQQPFSNSGWLAIGVASLAFGVVHFISPLYFLFATLAGVYLGIVFAWTGDLGVVIMAHAVYDFLILVIMLRTDWLE